MVYFFLPEPLRVVTKEAIGTAQSGKLPSIVSPSPTEARLPPLQEVFSASSDAHILNAIGKSSRSNEVEASSQRQLNDPMASSAVSKSHDNKRTEEQTTENEAVDDSACIDRDNHSEADQAIYDDRATGCSNQQRALLQGEGFCNPWLLEKVGQACLKP